MANQPVPVVISGATYHISCPEEEYDSLMQSAKLLDQRLKEARSKGGLPLEQATMMVALNLANEFLKAKHRHDSLERNFNGRIVQLIKKIEETGVDEE